MIDQDCLYDLLLCFSRVLVNGVRYGIFNFSDLRLKFEELEKYKPDVLRLHIQYCIDDGYFLESEMNIDNASLGRLSPKAYNFLANYDR